MIAVTVFVEQRYLRTPDGSIWGPQLGYSFWRNYLSVFDRVRVVARVLDVSSVSDQWVRADGDGVSFECIPYYVGPWEYLAKRRTVKQTLLAALGQQNALIMRLDSQLAAVAYPFLKQHHRPYGVEVVTDPYDVFAPGSGHVLRPVFRFKFAWQLKQQCAGACAAAYVTRAALQERYPPSRGAFSTWYSSVELPEERFIVAPRTRFGSQGSFRIVTVGSMEDFRKGQDTLLDAVASCVSSGLDVRLSMVGSGRTQRSLEARARGLGLKLLVNFTGQLSPERVDAELDQADLFVLASRGEGLPRSLLEAMARGLPAIGTSVGGFPEVLPGSDLVRPGDVVALASKIRDTLLNVGQMRDMSARNLAKARDYHQEVLCERRIKFYRAVRQQTEAWLVKV